MAIGATEIVTGFEVEAKAPNAPRILHLSVCGICGAAVFPGQEVAHENWHDLASWTRVPAATTTIRVARSPWEPNAP